MSVDSAQFPNNYTVVVAGAGSGIGHAVAAHLLNRGVGVVAVDRDASGLDTLVAAAPGAALTTRVVDAEDVSALHGTITSAVDEHGPLQGLLNCIGINPDAGTAAVDVDITTFDRVFRVNLRAALIMSQAVLPAMLAARYGRVVHVASIAGKEGNPGMVTYSSTKAGLIGMVKALGRELAGSGVVVNALAPAVINTPLVERTYPGVVEQMLSRIPMGRPGTLEECALMLEWMLSPACSYTTGFTFDLSGGRATY